MGAPEMNDFAFGACNVLRGKSNTRLQVRALLPFDSNDRCLLEQLAQDSQVKALLSTRRLKFAAPKLVETALGSERRMVEDYDQVHKPEASGHAEPRLRMSLGQLSRAAANQLLARDERFTPHRGCRELALKPGEVQQVLVRVEPSGAEDELYVIKVDHTADSGEYIGGMTVLFVPPWNPFREGDPRC